MKFLLLLIQVLAVTFGILAAVISIILFFRLHWPSPALWFLKLYTSALSPFLILIGVFSVLVGLTIGPGFLAWIGIYTIFIFGVHLARVTRPPIPSSGFEHAFGAQWEDKINKEIKKHMLTGRIPLGWPEVPEPRIEQNISYAVIPGTDRKLLCDVWQPPPSVPSSGLAFIYLHGGAWYLLDKDFNTRPFFSHLTAQGHVVMDVAYRLAPETDLMGMVNDVQRAIVYLKANAANYHINPNRIVLGGGSSGAHLALLAAYTSDNPRFNANELTGKDLGLNGVISLYGPADLEAMYYHTNQHLTTRNLPDKLKKPVPTQMPGWIIKKMGSDYHRLGMDKNFEHAGSFAPLLGCHPDECPETYALFSPVTHVHSGCPPTLLIHGQQDVMAPVKSTRVLYSRLMEKKVQTVMHILPQTDHGFDLVLPKRSPSAHNAIYDVDRWLALMVLRS